MPPNKSKSLVHELSQPIPIIPFAYNRDYSHMDGGNMMDYEDGDEDNDGVDDGDDLPSPEAGISPQVSSPEEEQRWRQLFDENEDEIDCSRVFRQE